MSRGKPPAPPIPLTVIQRALLEDIANKHKTPQQEAKRARILLLANEGRSNASVKREVGVALNTVKEWRRRWLNSVDSLAKFEGHSEKGVSSNVEYSKAISGFLRDLPRSGAPKSITLSQEQQIVALACESPSENGIEVTDWTHKTLALVAVQKGIIKSISSRQVGRILKKKPRTTP